MLDELIIAVAVGLLVLSLPTITLVLSIVAWRRSRRIAPILTRVAQLEATVESLNLRIQSFRTTASLSAHDSAIPAATMAEASAIDRVETERTEPFAAELAVAAVEGASEVSVTEPRATTTTDQPSLGWETFIGQKAFGWLAVILFAFSAAFFLRYAFQNNWIGPIGRVAIGELVGIGLVGAGAWYYGKGMTRFSSMMTSAGIVVVYLSTYSAFSLYRLMPQAHTGTFLGIIVFESMVAAILYRSKSIALAAVIGGLVTPLLLASNDDAYRSLFAYLAILNIGTAFAVTIRRWSTVPSVCYLGTQGLFWLWYAGNYHPEKFAWAIGFQALVFATYVVQNLFLARLSRPLAPAARPDNWEDLARFIVNAIFGFASFQVLLREAHQEWLGTLAISMASLYALIAQRSLSAQQRIDNRLLLTSLALSLGFIAWALPLQASTGWYAMGRWIGMGWAIIGFALWRFRLRVAAPTLGTFASVFALAATIRLLTRDLPLYVREPFIPIFNSFAFPSLVVAACILAAVLSADSQWKRLRRAEQIGLGISSVVGIAIVWLVLSLDCYGYFESRALFGGEIDEWRWRGQLALTVLWTLFATALLALGFRLDRARLRWLAMGLYAVTVSKLFVIDMANVQQIYRIIAFFILAVVLGLVARAYQRFK